ncbi:FAD-dependent oxidoreductase [candidate division KSB1 bacterium 4572_119]|nr:MAG: FAD-dependent oxidoreductase [candidate division KSB1 bacterium 4572_119]
MNRDNMLSRITDKSTIWDIVIIGGGATGIGAAIEAASRGYKVALFEMGDFGQGTSSRSTKLIHGGVRYLQHGNVSLVLEALKERGLLLQNAPHLVHNLPFIVPVYDWWESPFYGIGLKLYDILAGKHGFGKSKLLSKEETIKHIPTVETDGLRGGVIYYDGQFDDARLIINMAETAAEQGAAVLNYIEVTGLIKKSDGFTAGVKITDMETNKSYDISSKVIINATGVFADAVRHLDDPKSTPIIRPSQGVHIVLNKEFLPGNSAIMVPHTDDGRVLFAIPWHDRIIVGTTDTPVEEVTVEPRPFKEEIDFLLEHAARYLTKDPTKEDVLSIFAGLRPLVNLGGEENTADISRDHTVHISHSGLITIAGGKWTTYRNMAEDTINQAAILGCLDETPSVSEKLPIHGYHQHAHQFGDLSIYGSDAPKLQNLLHENPKYKEQLHPKMKYLTGEVIWAVRNEMARTADDFLSRRTRALLLDAKVSLEMAPKVIDLMAKELGRKKSWKREQLKKYSEMAKGYSLH